MLIHTSLGCLALLPVGGSTLLAFTCGGPWPDGPSSQGSDASRSVICPNCDQADE